MATGYLPEFPPSTPTGYLHKILNTLPCLPKKPELSVEKRKTKKGAKNSLEVINKCRRKSVAPNQRPEWEEDLKNGLGCNDHSCLER